MVSLNTFSQYMSEENLNVFKLEISQRRRRNRRRPVLAPNQDELCQVLQHLVPKSRIYKIYNLLKSKTVNIKTYRVTHKVHDFRELSIIYNLSLHLGFSAIVNLLTI